MKVVFCLLMIIIATSCNSISSSLNYSKGTECLEKGDYEEAVASLEKAVELDPDMGRNHTNLATAYAASGEWDKAWKQSRTGLKAKYPDEHGLKSFDSIYKAYVTSRGIDKIGNSRKMIEERLGPPDMVLANGDQYKYGLVIMTFKNDVLKHVVYPYPQKIADSACTNQVYHPPTETIVLKLPKGSLANWKEISRCVNEQKGSVECIPLNQQSHNWSEMICIQLYGRSGFDQKKSIPLENILDSIREENLSAHPSKKITWKVIEKNKNDIIYECISHEPCKGITEHEIAHIFLSEKNLHRIGFTRRNNEMSSDEREEKIKLLRESVSIVSLEEAATISDGLSLADKNHSDLGPAFYDWVVSYAYMLDHGSTLVCHIPKSQASYITEFMQTLVMPNWDASSIDQLFEAEKNTEQRKSIEKIDFQVIKKTPNEIIYCYSYPQDDLQLKVNAVTRSFISDQEGYCSIRYKHALPEWMKKEEILQWKEKLEALRICNGVVQK